MARADVLISLVKAAMGGDMVSFRKVVESVIAEERTKKHHIIADRLSGLMSDIQQSLVSSDVIDEEGYLKEDCSRSDIRSAIPETFNEYSDLITETIISEKKN